MHSFSPSLLHRLDRETSGVILCSLSLSAHLSLYRQFESRLISKKYMAIVNGEIPKEDEGQISVPIGVISNEKTEEDPDGPSKKKWGICFDTGKESHTLFKVIKRWKKSNCALMEMKPTTGRTHQIRIHLSHLGCPILGDSLYSSPSSLYPSSSSSSPSSPSSSSSFPSSSSSSSSSSFSSSSLSSSSSSSLSSSQTTPITTIATRHQLHAAELSVSHPATSQQIKFEAPIPDDMKKIIDELTKFEDLKEK